jgi:hypothetical protein
MREFTPEEKELIVNTPINKSCFDMNGFLNVDCFEDLEYGTQDLWVQTISCLERMRKSYLETKNEYYFTELVRLLPNSYKVVNLCGERKDVCKGKHQVPETPHFGRESKAVPCYKMYSCYSCELFKK